MRGEGQSGEETPVSKAAGVELLKWMREGDLTSRRCRLFTI